MAYIWILMAVVVIGVGFIAISRRDRDFDETGNPSDEASYEEEQAAVDREEGELEN